MTSGLVLAVALVAALALPLQAAEGQRPFVFKECRPLSVRVGDLPDSLKRSKDDIKAVIEKRLKDAGFLAEAANDLTLRLRIVELPPPSGMTRAYLVDLDVFHRMDDHEYGSGLVILWGTLGIEQYRTESVPVRGLTELAEELTESFVDDYRADGCGRSSGGWW